MSVRVGHPLTMCPARLAVGDLVFVHFRDFQGREQLRTCREIQATPEGRRRAAGQYRVLCHVTGRPVLAPGHLLDYRHPYEVTP